MTSTTLPAPLSGAARARITLATALTPVAWGSTYLVTTELLPQHHPAFSALVRALPAGLVALVLGGHLPRGRWWRRSLVTGALSIGLFFPLLFMSAERLPGGVAATFGALQPLIVAVLATRLLRERLSPGRLAWGVAGVVGVALVVLGPTAALDPLGVVAAIAGAASMALGVVLTKRWGRPEGVPAISFVGWQLTAGGLVLLPLAVVEGAPDSVHVDAAVGYLWLGSVGCLVAYTLWFRGIERLPVSGVAMLGLLSPVVAAALGALVLHQTLTPVQLVGFAIALAAILGGQLTGSARPSSPPTHPSFRTEGASA